LAQKSEKMMRLQHSRTIPESRRFRRRCGSPISFKETGFEEEEVEEEDAYCISGLNPLVTYRKLNRQRETDRDRQTERQRDGLMTKRRTDVQKRADITNALFSINCGQKL
jgi:hypothetical protein